MKPTGKKLEYTLVAVDKIVDGKIIEHGGAANIFEAYLNAGGIKVVEVDGDFPPPSAFVGVVTNKNMLPHS
jgi:hypothetical protein